MMAKYRPKFEFLESFMPIGIRKGRVEKAKAKYRRMGYELKITKSKKYGTLKLWGRK